MKITHEMLKTFGACEERSTAFRAAWPDGCSIEEGAAWATRDDLLWLAQYANLPSVAEAAYHALLSRPDVTHDDLRYLAGYTRVPSVAEAAYRELLSRPDVTHDDLRWLAQYANLPSVAEAAKKELEK